MTSLILITLIIAPAILPLALRPATVRAKVPHRF
jgi:hypothetical protein